MLTPDTRAGNFESFERINLIHETNENFDSCSLCKRLGTSRLPHELHDRNLRLFHVSNLSVRNYGIFLLMYPGLLSRIPTNLAECVTCFSLVDTVQL